MNHAQTQSLVAEAALLLDSEEMAGLGAVIWSGLRHYLIDRVETGGFLRCCLENDFAGAMSRAHPSLTVAQLKLIGQLLNGGFPAMAWGSREKVAAWLGEGEKAELK